MQASIEVRPARPEDVEQVLPMVQRLADAHCDWDPGKYPYKTGVGEMYRAWLTARADDPRSVFLVALRGERIVAFLVGTVEREIPIYTIAEYGFIHDLFVDEGYRNEGVARQMVMLAIERFGEMGVSQVRLDTAANNEVARSLFRACGFRPSAIEMLVEL